jgi:hypothetical protein
MIGMGNYQILRFQVLASRALRGLGKSQSTRQRGKIAHFGNAWPSIVEPLGLGNW